MPAKSYHIVTHKTYPGEISLQSDYANRITLLTNMPYEEGTYRVLHHGDSWSWAIVGLTLARNANEHTSTPGLERYCNARINDPRVIDAILAGPPKNEREAKRARRTRSVLEQQAKEWVAKMKEAARPKGRRYDEQPLFSHS